MGWLWHYYEHSGKWEFQPNGYDNLWKGFHLSQSIDERHIPSVIKNQIIGLLCGVIPSDIIEVVYFDLS